jgi:hypothetical protein
MRAKHEHLRLAFRASSLYDVEEIVRRRRGGRIGGSVRVSEAIRRAIHGYLQPT